MPRSCAGADPAVLALHGYTGTPQEMDIVLSAASSLGLRASAPLLPGHGTKPTDLEGVRYEQWLEVARSHLARLGATGKVIVVGLSLGSLLATLLAAEEPEKVVGLGLLGSAHFLPGPYPAWPLWALSLFPRLPRLYVPKDEADIEDPARRREHLGYSSRSIGSAVEVFRAAGAARRVLGRVKCPVLLAHGALDRVCRPQSLARIAARLGTQDLRQVVLARSGHVITSDRDRDQLGAELLAFFERQVTLAALRSSASC